MKPRFGMDRVQHGLRGQLVAAHRREHIVHVAHGEARQSGLQEIAAKRLLGALERVLHDALPEPGIFATGRGAVGAANGLARFARHHHLLPGRGRHLYARAHDLDLVAVAKLGHERHDPPVYLGARAGVAHIGVDGIGEIDRCRAARQGDQGRLGREAEHLVLKEFELGVLEEFLGVPILERVDRAAQPRIGIRAPRHAGLRARRAVGALVLVDGVGGNAVLGGLVHLVGADLQFDPLARWAHDGGVQGAVIVGLGRRDVVLEAPGHGLPAKMHRAQRRVAILRALHQDPKAENVRELFERQALGLHLGEHRIGFLAPPAHQGGNAARGEQVAQFVLHRGDQIAVALANLAQPRRHGPKGLGIDVPERQLLQFLAHVLHAHAPGERRVDIHGFLGNAAALLLGHVVERAHVVEAIGQLHEQDPHILGDGDQELAQVFGLLGAARSEIELVELGQSLHQGTDLLAEQAVDLVARGVGVLDRVVQKRHRNGALIDVHLGQDLGHREGVGDVGLARSALLRPVLLHGVNIGPVEQVLVHVRLVGANALDQLELAHGPARALGGCLALRVRFSAR